MDTLGSARYASARSRGRIGDVAEGGAGGREPALQRPHAHVEYAGDVFGLRVLRQRRSQGAADLGDEAAAAIGHACGQHGGVLFEDARQHRLAVLQRCVPLGRVEGEPVRRRAEVDGRAEAGRVG